MRMRISVKMAGYQIVFYKFDPIANKQAAVAWINEIRIDQPSLVRNTAAPYIAMIFNQAFDQLTPSFPSFTAIPTAASVSLILSLVVQSFCVLA